MRRVYARVEYDRPMLNARWVAALALSRAACPYALDGGVAFVVTVYTQPAIE
jgi:hypothetical protein